MCINGCQQSDTMANKLQITYLSRIYYCSHILFIALGLFPVLLIFFLLLGRHYSSHFTKQKDQSLKRVSNWIAWYCSAMKATELVPKSTSIQLLVLAFSFIVDIYPVNPRQKICQLDNSLLVVLLTLHPRNSFFFCSLWVHRQWLKS